MERKELARSIEAITHRIKDFPDAAIVELFQALGEIERKYDLLEPLSEKDRLAIEESLADIEAGRFITHEQLQEEFAHILKDYDADAAGKDAFADAASRVRLLPGEEQNDVSKVIFALLDGYRFDGLRPEKNL